MEINYEEIKLIYEELADYKRFGFSFPKVTAEDLLRHLKDSNTPIVESVQKLSKDDEYLAGAIKIKDFSLYSGNIVETRKRYISGYQDLSFDEFCSYIYWRTLVRKKEGTFVPGGFLALYLIELVNFIEVDELSEALQIITYLEILSENSAANLKQISNARRELILLYGTQSEAENIIDYAEYEYLVEDNQIVGHSHKNLLNILCKRHYSAFLKSKMYIEHKEALEQDFQNFFYRIMDFFKSNHILFLELYYGNMIFSCMRNIYVKNIDYARVIKKELKYKNICIVKVNEQILTATKSYTDGTLENRGHLYVRGVVMKYLLRLYEHKMRLQLGYPKTYPCVDEIYKGFCHTETANVIMDILESDEFCNFFYN